MDFVVTFYNGEYPQLYPEELIKNLKAQDKTQNRAQDNIEERILNFCKEEKIYLK